MQTTALTGDEPTVTSLLDGTSNSALDFQVIELEKREKRQTPNRGIKLARCAQEFKNSMI